MIKTTFKRFVACIVVLVLLMSALPSCTSGGYGDGSKINIIVTVFPAYDWVRELVGENNDAVNVTFLLDNGVDLHSFQPTADDIIKVSSCDMLVYVGGSSDKWIDDVLRTASNKDMKVINLMSILEDDLLCAEVKNGQPHDHDDHDHDHQEDEHVWLSLRNAQKACDSISTALGELDPDNKTEYEKNFAEYSAELSSLDAEFANTVDKAKTKTLLFGDRFPFIYLTSDYGIENYAAFSGCSAESEASFETVTYLASKVDELGLKYIMTTEDSVDGIANTIISATAGKNATVLSLDSMQSKTKADIEAGETYLSVMRENLEVLSIALN